LVKLQDKINDELDTEELSKLIVKQDKSVKALEAERLL